MHKKIVSGEMYVLSNQARKGLNMSTITATAWIAVLTSKLWRASITA